MNYLKENPNFDLGQQQIAEYKKSGDLGILGQLFKPYMPLVYGVCLKYFKNEEDAKDAVIQIFEQLITKVEVHEIKNFKSWLYVLSKNYCLMELRKGKKMTIVNIEDHFMELDSISHHDDSNEWHLTAMEECLETLTSEQKVSVSLFYLQQKCYQEVAEATGFELKKVKSYIQNGKRNLKICIEKKSE
jgi:RNA polymerase sigma-70 factor (ECF subfamily)